MATDHPSTADHQEGYDILPVINSIDDHSFENNDDNYFKEKFNKIKLQIPKNSETTTVLWSVHTASHLHIGYLPYLLIMNLFNESSQKFVIISNVRGYFGNLNTELSEHDTKMETYYEILSHFNLGTLIKSDDIYYTKEYQRSFFQLSRSVKILEAIESIRITMNKTVGIEMIRASDLYSILLTLNDIIYFNISHVLIEEHEASIYKFISCLLLNEYGKTLEILVIPRLPDLHGSEILLNASRDQIHDQFSKLKLRRQTIIRNYLKAIADVLYNDQISFENESIEDIMDNMRKQSSLSSSLNCNSPIYVAASFLTDQFHVLKKHWKKHINKDDKCTGTGKGLEDLQVNQKGYEPPLGGKFIIINWFNKEIVYTLDIDAPAGFFINENYLYITNNRLNYINVIDLTTRTEIRRIDNLAFNCLHSLHQAENETLVVTSTGIDAIIQTDSNGETLSDWYATEHGYSTTSKGDKRNVQRDFDHHHYIYPTLHQTTHINSAIILDSDHFLATLFHQGLLVKINRLSGKTEILLSGLNCPHGIKRFKSIKPNEIVWMICNTKQNELLLLNENFKIIQKMILEDISWLQDASQIQNEHIIIADANNSRIIEIDSNTNMMISEFVYSTDWRIYQISDLTDFQTSFIPS